MSSQNLLNSLLNTQGITAPRWHDFLHQHAWHEAECTFLAGDCSPRQYYRLAHKAGTSAVLMDTPLCQKPRQFDLIARLLQDYQLSSPKILAADFENGFMILEDWGNNTYSRALDIGANASELYMLAIDVLIHLHQNLIAQPTFIPEYTYIDMITEINVFIDWYWPQVYDPMTEQQRQDFLKLWKHPLLTALQGPNRLVLRDFHVDNLMILANRTQLQRCGLLDFQDALWGPVVYDLISLVEDARRDVSPEISQMVWARYAQAFPKWSMATLQSQGSVLSAARHIKILGIFMRQAVRDGKTVYLSHLPRVWRLLEDCLKTAPLTSIKNWFNAHPALKEVLPCT